MRRSRRLVEEWLEQKERVYGVTTGFGEFSNVNIPFDKIEELQQNLIASHAAGTGEPLPPKSCGDDDPADERAGKRFSGHTP